MRVASLVTAGLLTLAGNFGADAQIVLPERGLREMSAEAQQFQYERKVIPLEGGRFGWIAAKGDLNHDGVPDLVSIAHNGSLQLAVWLSNGAGSYQSASHMYAVPSRFMDPKVVDVNKDGHLDVAGAEQLPGPNASKVLIFLGDGSGMLRAPVVTEVKGANPDFADFNADGKVDAVVAGEAGEPRVHLGMGDGSFAANSITSDDPTGFSSYHAGDFDGDGFMDIVGIIKPIRSDNRHEMRTGFRYGDRTGRFSPPTVSPAYFEGDLWTLVDLNNDGRTDLLGTYRKDSSTELQLFGFVVHGTADRKFVDHHFDRGGWEIFGKFPAGDFDNDGDLDLVKQSYQIQYRSGDTYAKPVEYHTSVAENLAWPAADDFTRDGKADIVVTSVDQDTREVNGLELFRNVGSGGCAVPSGNGVNVCTPMDGSVMQSPVRLRAAAKLSGAVYRFEVWVNGTKIHTGRDTSSIDTSVVLASGTYMMTFVARTASGERQEKTIKVNVGGTTPPACGRPSAQGINVCEPAPFAEVTSPITVHAFANTGNSATYRFELWDGPTKLFTVRDADEMNTSVTLSRGTHRLSFVARRLDGTRYSKDVIVTVK